MPKELINFWSKVTIYCMNHETPVEMKIAENRELIKTPFYACRYYFPENTDDAHMHCPNRLNIDDYQGLVLKLIDVVANGDMNTNYTNYHYDYKGPRHKIFVKVLKYSEDEVRLGIINRTVLGG